MWPAIVREVAALLSFGAMDGGPPALQVALAVSDRAGIGAKRLGRGMERVEAIFGRAGIRVVWWSDAVCDPADSRCFDIVILDNAPASARGSTVGFVEERDSRNWRVVVVWRRILEEARQYLDESEADVMLGCAVAHELGHAIEKSREHGQGVMCERWKGKEWLATVSGGMEFLPDQAKRLRQRLSPAGR